MCAHLHTRLMRHSFLPMVSHYSTNLRVAPRNSAMHQQRSGRRRLLPSKQRCRLKKWLCQYCMRKQMHSRLLYRAPLKHNWQAANLWDIVGDVCRDAGAPQLLDNIDGFGHWRMPHWNHQHIAGAHWWLIERKNRMFKEKKQKLNKTPDKYWKMQWTVVKKIISGHIIWHSESEI